MAALATGERVKSAFHERDQDLEFDLGAPDAWSRLDPALGAVFFWKVLLLLFVCFVCLFCFVGDRSCFIPLCS